MKLIKASYKILTPINGEDILKQIEFAARTCYKSEDKIKYDDSGWNKPNETSIAKSARILIPKLINRRHEAMLEFGGNITVKFICDRGVSHELVRHRIASFAQESTRYCNYGKDKHIQFIIPCWFGKDWINNLEELKCTTADINTIPCNIDDTDSNLVKCFTVKEWCYQMANAEISYNTLLTKGWSPQQARSVLPNSLKTEINVSANIREWRYIFKLRTAKAAHPQMKEVMIPLLNEFKSKIPLLFDDILKDE